MSNPVTPFRNNLFASRGMDIQEALNYAEIMINTLSSTDQVAVRTAFGVVINTIDSAVTQSQGPSPEKLAEAIKVADRAALIATLISEKLRAQLAAATAQR